MSLQLVIDHGGTTEKVPDLSQRRRIVMRTKDQRVSQKKPACGISPQCPPDLGGDGSMLRQRG
jgi:hypothetical protein